MSAASADADKEYLKRHGLPALFNELTQELFRARPENPVAFLLEQLKKKKASQATPPAAAADAAPAATAAA